MEIKKRVRAELRDLLAQKKLQQEELAVLVGEVCRLREEKEVLLKELSLEKLNHLTTVELFKQGVDFLKKEKTDLTLQINSTQVAVSELETQKQLILEQIRDVEVEHTKVLGTILSAKNEARTYLDKIEVVRENYNTLQDNKYGLETELKFLSGKIAFAKSELDELNNAICQAKTNLESVLSEQSRHSQWDEYLQEKENFLIEQFKLLGVKYVVYNSR
jgi:chromosome segregation ATPase